MIAAWRHASLSIDLTIDLTGACPGAP